MTTQHELLARAIESLRSAKNHVAATAGAQSMLDGFGKKKQRPADRELAEINALIDEFDNLPPAVAAEPVAWQYRELIYDVAIVDWSDCDKSEFDRFNEEPWQYETRALYTEQPAALSADPVAEMCPNCQTPWKCNGPHITTYAQSAPESIALSDELKTSLRELVSFYEMWPEDDEGGHAALVRAFLDSAK